MKKLRLVLAGALLTALAATPAEAARPVEVLIEVDLVVRDDGPTHGTFTASGPICSSGHTTDVFVHVAGSQSERRVQMLVGREFMCDDGSGTFLLLVRVHGQFDEPGSEVFVHPVPKSWSVLSGTGAFEKLHGAGTGFGVATADGFADTLAGRMHTEEFRR